MRGRVLTGLEARAPTLASRTSYRPDIDGLRAVAVASVLLFHCGVPGFSGGYVGVDVFFVISGYLITGHLASDIAAERMSILRFYERRIRRIVPALFVMLLLAWFAATWVLLPFYLLETSKALIAAAASVSNIYLWRTANYFAFDSSFQPLLHTWSLSVEEQFYLVIPVLMMLTAKPLRGRWIWLFGPLCVVSFTLSQYATTTFATANFYLLPTRAWELGLGALVATARLPLITRRPTAELTGLAALLLILLPVFLFNDATPFPGLNAIYPCLGSALLIHVGRSARPTATALISTQPFVALGLISYSLYLVHWPIVSLMRYRDVGALDPAQIVAVLIASLVLATISWHFIEQPFRRPNPVLTQRRILLGGVTAAVATCLVGWTGILTQGFPSRFPDFAEQDIPGRVAWKPDRCFLADDLNYRRWSLPDCIRITTGPTRILLWGDSFAAQYMPGLLANAGELKATVIQYTAAGCLPVLGSRSYGLLPCQGFSDHVLSIIREQKIDTVVIAGRWTNLQQDDFARLASTLAVLDRERVRTVVIGQSPEFSIDVQVISYLKGSRAPDAVNRWPVLFPLSINDKLAAVAGNHEFLNPMTALCVKTVCDYQDRGTYLYSDDGHYSADGSDRAVRALLLHLNMLGAGPDPHDSPHF